MRNRMRLAAVVAVAFLLVGGLNVASAARLPVSSGSVSTVSATSCTETAVRVTRDTNFFGTWSTITFTLPESCWGLRIDALSDPLILGVSTRTVADGTPNGSVSIRFGSVSLTRNVVVLVDGWQIPITVQ